MRIETQSGQGQAPASQAALRMFGYLRPHWRVLVAAYVSLLFVLASQLAVPELISRIIDDGIAKSDRSFILYGGLGLVGLAVGRSIFSFLQTYLAEVAAQRTAYDVRNLLYQKIQSLSFTYHDRAQTGQLVTRATSDVDQIHDFVGGGLLQLLNSLLMLVGTAAILVSLNWRLAVFSLAALIVLIFFIMRFGSRISPIFRTMQEERGALNTVLQENLAGVRVVKAFAREKYAAQRFGDQNKRLLDRTLSLFRLFATNLPLFMIVSSLGTLVVLWYGGGLVMRQQLTLGELVAFNTYLLMLMMPVRMMGFLAAMASRATASAQRVNEILDTPLDITDAPDAVDLPPIEGKVRFENVSFSYYGGTETLHDVSFEAQTGQVIALLGATGSGKTTIINLIPRFYDVTSGRVTIDGYDVREVIVSSLRRQIGSVLQETALFSGTVRDNIAYGCPEASDEDVIAAAKAAEAHDFVMKLPDGYQSMVGERGATLSGGQRQRVAIARALLLDPKILILDDSTSSVDVQTEFQIQQALSRLMAGRTSFIIAQRVSTVQSADQILVLDRGRIVARGRHTELLQDSPIYAELYRLQLGNQPGPEEVELKGEQPAWSDSSPFEGRWP